MLLSLLALCSSPAQAQNPVTAGIHVIWTSDATTTPVTLSASTAGALGGGATTIHLSLVRPDGMFTSCNATVTVHENACHYADTTLTTSPAQMSALCGDPAGPPPPTMDYLDVSWMTTTLHNGIHTLTVSGQYNMLEPNGMGGYGPITYAICGSIQVDVENLLITSTSPSNPTPILWDPAAVTSVNLSATMTACYKSNQPVTLKIYTSDQLLVRTYTTTATIGPSATTVAITWDGTSDDMTLYPDRGDGPAPPVGKGVYLFQWIAGATGTGQDYTRTSRDF